VTGKTAPKTSGFQKGFDPKRGHGQPGRSGRKPDAFRAECARLCDGVLLLKLRAYVTEKEIDAPGYKWAADRLLEYGKGKPIQYVAAPEDHDGDVIPFPVRIVDARDD
jgi:hypothetical protein